MFFMIGLEEGILPHRTSIDDGMIEKKNADFAHVGIPAPSAL